ncbi:HNH endonuclease [Embleya sp. NPDC005971]|uniref:HNH endonuclease n=1 Tax=Embleya sp. NPDC005971 TaxID=3156724 RepID=UPI0033D6FF9C
MPGGWTDSTRRTRLPSDWPARCAAVYARNGRTCHVCGLDGANQIDHIEPGDDHSLDNLAPIHDDPCHRAKSSAEGRRAAAARRAEGRYPEEPHPSHRT